MLPQTRLEKTLGGTQIAKDVCSSDLCSRKSFVHRHEIHARRIFLSKRNSLVRVECCRKPGWRKLWAVPHFFADLCALCESSVLSLRFPCRNKEITAEERERSHRGRRENSSPGNHPFAEFASHSLI